MPERKKRPGALTDLAVEALGPFKFMQSPPKAGHRLTTDSVLLAEFVQPIDKGCRVADLGTGTGAIPLLIIAKAPGAHVTGIEIDRDLAAIARENVSINGLEDKIEIIEGDLREAAKQYPEGAFGVVVGNPPYVRKGAGRVSPVRSRAIARSEELCTLPELIRASCHLAGKKGRIAFVYPVSRLAGMLKELEKAGFKAIKLRFIHSGKKKEAGLFLIEAGRAGDMKVVEPVFL
jgi:tRNA1Val (adenine37-N6)-methyltransferase